MFLPFGFLIGVAILLAGSDAMGLLPGAGSIDVALLWSPLLALPAVLARLADRCLCRALARGGLPQKRVFLLLRAAAAAVPVTLLLWLVATGWPDTADRLGGTSFLATVGLLLLPLLAMEVARLVAETPLRERLDRAGFGAGALPLARRIGTVAFTALPWLLLAGLVDVLQCLPATTAFLLVTGPGRALGALAAGATLALVLPVAFRVTMGLSSRLPESVAGPLGQTAESLGMPRRCLLVMPTGRRMANALLLGVLPWPRYLVLTDALLGMLDLFALRGVVAHEVGHARAGHLAIALGSAMIVLPLGVSIAQQADLLDGQPARLAIVGIAAVAALLYAAHRVAHRFEHEADVLSASALGGAQPCIRALQGAAQYGEHDTSRGSFLHPSEERRIRLLETWDRDPAFRERFARGGRRLRRFVFGVWVATALGATWSWWAAWPAERAMLSFELGEFARARVEVAAAAGQVRSGLWQSWQRFGEEVEAANAVAGPAITAEDWPARVHEPAWRRGVELLLGSGPAAARPFFAIAVSVASSPVQRSVALFCDAVVDGDAAGEQALRRHIVKLGCPPELLPLFGR